MIDTKTNLQSAVIDEKTLSSNSKRSMINEIAQMKTFHTLSTSESTSDSEIARFEADETRRQAEATRANLNQLHSKQRLNKKILINEIEHFAQNAQKNEDQDDKFDTMMLETSETSKSNDFRLQVYQKVEQYLETLMMNSENDEAKAQLHHLNELIKKQNIKNEFSKKNLDDYFIQVLTFIAHFELIKDLYESLQKNSIDYETRKILITINQTLNQLNERHNYSKI
jgi:hypothetical protein